MRKRREAETFGMSFLDVVCCGFGAIVLLLIISKTVEPIMLEESSVDLQGAIRDLQKQLFEIRGESTVLNRDLNAKRDQFSDVTSSVAILRGRIEALRARLASLTDAQNASSTEEQKLALALQSLTAEMRRLQQQQSEVSNNLIGGIPVDSEYIIFIIDTSGSMFNNAWGRVRQEMINILDIYPEVKGLQIMNDMGGYMFSDSRGRWLEDNKIRRDAIVKRLSTWNPFSNSSPVEGINAAIRSFYSRDKKISIYVLGDEFTGRSIENVINTVKLLNRSDDSEEPRVRIHAVGFPVQFANPAYAQGTGIRFASLMRELTYNNAGTFVGLNDYR